MHATLPWSRLWVAAIAVWPLLCPASGPAAPGRRLAVIRSAEAGEATALDGEVGRTLGAVLSELVVEVPVEDRCRPADGGCLAGLARANDAEATLHVSLRPVGGTPSLCLLRADATGGPASRIVEPLRPGVPVAPTIREAVFRLLAPDRATGALEVQATEGSEIWIDGTRRGAAPLPPITGLSPGQHLLRVVRPGGGEARGTVEVRFETLTKVRIEPRSDELHLVAHDDAPPTRPDPSPVPPDAIEVPIERFPTWTFAGWTAVAAGGTLVLGAVLPALAAERARDDARRLRDHAGVLPRDRADDDRRLAAEVRGHERTAAILASIGASLFFGGATLLVLDLDQEAP